MANDQANIIGKGITIRGSLSGGGDLVIEGRVEGQISLKNHLTIESSGRVEADIRADELTINGEASGNIDASVVTDHPKLAPARDEMQMKLSGAVGAPVTVKGRRPEGLGALGRGEGVACWAVAILTSSGDEAVNREAPMTPITPNRTEPGAGR